MIGGLSNPERGSRGAICCFSVMTQGHLSQFLPCFVLLRDFALTRDFRTIAPLHWRLSGALFYRKAAVFLRRFDAASAAQPGLGAGRGGRPGQRQCGEAIRAEPDRPTLRSQEMRRT